jgi:signal transduction histidine kinase
MTTTIAKSPQEAELASILRAYNEVTERLRQSHDVLAREVCRLREELREKNIELQRRERLADLGEMAAGVAHEIRNPLGGMQLFASLLDRDLEDRPKERNIVHKMLAAIVGLDKIVSDILAFSADTGLALETVHAGKLINAALDHAAPQMELYGTEVVVDESLSSVELSCDGAQIERALANLILNAVDAAGSRGHVWVTREAGGDRARLGICIADDGPGIAPEVLQRVFNPFYTTKETGTGLGLAIVNRIAESNGGTVSAGARRGGGAAFVLSIPRVE